MVVNLLAEPTQRPPASSPPPISMAYAKKLRLAIGLLKDRASLIKSSLSTKRYSSSVRRVVLRVTTHGPPSPPSDYRISSLLSLGHRSRATASLCIQTLMDRLHTTRNAAVALKCLYSIHAVLLSGSFILKDQLSIYPSSGGWNFLNLSTFRDDSDSESLETSTWVRWYAAVLEQSVAVSRALGYHLSASSCLQNETRLADRLSSDLLREVEAMVGFVEETSVPPDSVRIQRNSLGYEVVRLVSENYRLIQREILLRVAELEARKARLGMAELTQLASCLKRLEDCKARLSAVFANRRRNDELWDLVRETKEKALDAMEEKRTSKVLMIEMGGESVESNQAQWFPPLAAAAGGPLGPKRIALTQPTISTVR